MTRTVSPLALALALLAAPSASAQESGPESSEPAVVTWNGLKFDVPFLETRLRRWGLGPLAIARHKDLLYTARYKLRLHANKLDDVAEHLGVRRKYGVAKTKLEPERWTMALGGHEPSYRYIVTHCQEDVKVLACVWQEIKHLVTEIK